MIEGDGNTVEYGIMELSMAMRWIVIFNEVS